MRDVFGVPPIVGFEVGTEIGASLAATEDYKRWDQQVDAIKAGMEWGNKELGWNLDIDAYMKIVRHNARIIFKLRRREIHRQLTRGERTNYHMEMNADNCLKLGLIFEPPKQAPVKSASSKQLMRELAD
jgi:hypothetical protein